MDQITTAIYENGVLRPAVSLDLPEHSEVEITIHTHGDSLDDKVGRLAARSCPVCQHAAKDKKVAYKR